MVAFGSSLNQDVYNIRSWGSMCSKQRVRFRSPLNQDLYNIRSLGSMGSTLGWVLFSVKPQSMNCSGSIVGFSSTYPTVSIL